MCSPIFYSMSYPEFVKQLKSLKLKKKGNKSKVSPNKFYPSQAELQTNEVLKGELDDYARRLMKGALDNGVKGVYDVLGAPPESFKKEVDRIAKEVSDFNVKVFADFSNMVVGERYFPSTDKKDLILRTWKENFVNLCKSTNEEMRKKSAGIISDGVLSGRNLNEMVKELQNTCSDFSRNKAELIATTEIGKLNTAISKAQNESAGIKYYEWAAAMDGRTRESHASMDGRICAWDNDDVYYEWVDGKEGKRELKEFKRTEKMYHGAPGTDFRCRCVAIPYIPEFEDDYEQERTEDPIQGVVQGIHTDPKTIERNKEIAERKKKQTLKKSQKKSRDSAIYILNKRYGFSKDKIIKIIKPPYKESGEYTLADNETITLSKKNNKEKQKFIEELKMAKLIEDQEWLSTVFIGETSEKGEKNPDAVIDGVLAEYKHTEHGSGKNAVNGKVREALSQKAKIIVIDVQSDLNRNDVWNAINGRMKGVEGVKVYFKLNGSDKIYRYK